METRKEMRVKVARKIHALQTQMVQHGTWDAKKINLIKVEIDELEGIRKSLFAEGEEVEMKAKLKESKPKWSGAYTDYQGYVGGAVGFNDLWADPSKPEWTMKWETAQLKKVEKALADGNLEEYINLRRQAGIK